MSTSIHGELGKVSGFSLLQILVALAVIGILSSIAVPGYQGYIQRSRSAQAVGTLGEIELAIRQFVIENNGVPPDDLADVDHDGTAVHIFDVLG